MLVIENSYVRIAPKAFKLIELLLMAIRLLFFVSCVGIFLYGLGEWQNSLEYYTVVYFSMIHDT